MDGFAEVMKVICVITQHLNIQHPAIKNLRGRHIIKLGHEI